MTLKILLHGATNWQSSNYGDFIYGKLIYNYLKNKGYEVSFYQPSKFFQTGIDKYAQLVNKKNADIVIYIPGGYFGEGHNARMRDNAIQFLRFMPLGLWASYNMVPMAIVGIGAGPNHNFFMNRAIKRICDSSYFISVRDKESYCALKNISPKANIIESGDLIITKPLDIISKSVVIEDIIHKTQNKKILLVHYNYTKNALFKFAHVIKKFLNNHLDYTIVVAYDSIYYNSIEYFNEFKKTVEHECIYFDYNNADELTTLIKIADVVVTCKLHLGVVACLFNKSVIVAACHPEKTARFYNQIGESSRCVSLDAASEDDILYLLESYYDKKININEAIKSKANLSWNLLDDFLSRYSF